MNASTAESHEEGDGSGNNIDSEEPSPTRSGGERQRPSASAGAAAGGTHVQAGGGGQGVYGREEVSALKGIFSLYDAENTGTIGVKELEGILQKVGHNPGESLLCSRTERHIPHPIQRGKAAYMVRDKGRSSEPLKVRVRLRSVETEAPTLLELLLLCIYACFH